MRSRICPTRIFPTRTRSFWFRTISIRTHPRRSTKPSPPPKRVASSNGSNGITRPSTEAGSTWPNPELAVLSTQSLDRRIPDKPKLTAEVAAWVQHRNKHHAKANWQFTTADARVKLARLYPQFE